MSSSGLALIAFSCLLLVTSTTALRIAAFNVQIFGQSKVSQRDILNVLIKIVKSHDIILIQEVRDSSQTAIDSLVDAVNADPQTKGTYTHETSARLGRTSSKEQYSFIYRTDSVTVAATYQYPDTEEAFQREPFAVKFRARNTVPSEFVLVAIHTDPDTAIQEMNALVTVHLAIQQKWHTNNILIMGDFNAGCQYASKKALKGLKLRTDPTFTWLISDDVDTTATDSSCAYDRFVVSGDQLKTSIVPNSAKVVHYDEALSLSQEQTLRVSDHYPIELQIQSTSGSARNRMEI